MEIDRPFALRSVESNTTSSVASCSSEPVKDISCHSEIEISSEYQPTQLSVTDNACLSDLCTIHDHQYASEQGCKTYSNERSVPVGEPLSQPNNHQDLKAEGCHDNLKRGVQEATTSPDGKKEELTTLESHCDVPTSSSQHNPVLGFRMLVQRKSVFAGLGFSSNSNCRESVDEVKRSTTADENEAQEDADGTLKCGYCDERFFDQKVLVGHLRTHGRGKNHDLKSRTEDNLGSRLSGERNSLQKHDVLLERGAEMHVDADRMKFSESSKADDGRKKIQSRVMMSYERCNHSLEGNYRNRKYPHQTIHVVENEFYEDSDIGVQDENSQCFEPVDRRNVPMASVGKRNAKKRLSDDYCIPNGRSWSVNKKKRKIDDTHVPLEFPPVKNVLMNEEMPSDRQLRHVKGRTELVKQEKGNVSPLGFSESMSRNNVKLHSRQSEVKSPEDDHSNTCLRCITCKGCFLWKLPFLEHLREHPNDMPFQCLQCSERFTSFQSYSTHMTRIHSDEASKIHTCKKCGKKFSSYRKLKNHICGRKCSEYRCELCNKLFDLKADVVKHLSTHVSPRREMPPFTCKPCGKAFKYKRLLFMHLKRHPNANKPFSCTICGQSFAMHRWLESHIQRHALQRKFPCDICGRTYLTKGDAIMHKRRHTLERKFDCKICEKTFVYRSELNAHLKKHQGVKLQKNIPCPVCGKMFATRRDLQRHDTVHTGERPYECPLCGRRFSQEVNMQIHIKIHTNVRPHSCTVCEKSFITKSKLLRHQVSHTKPKCLLPKPYKCVLCYRKYTAENSLIRHLKTHKDSPDTVHSLTQALNKALDESKNTSNANAGAVLATLIDQAIIDAKLISKRGKEDMNVLSESDRSLAEIIDQAIHNSKAVSLGTQSPIVLRKTDVKPPIEGQQDHKHVSITLHKDEEIKPGDARSSSADNDLSIETVIVEPKGTVINYGLTDHRKYSQGPSLLNQGRHLKPSIQYISVKDLDITSTLAASGSALQHQSGLESGLIQKTFLLQQSPNTPAGDSCDTQMFQPNVQKQKCVLLSANPTAEYQDTFPSTSRPTNAVPELKSRPISSNGDSLLKQNQLPSSPTFLNNRESIILLPTRGNAKQSVLFQGPRQIQHFILQNNSQGEPLLLPASAAISQNRNTGATSLPQVVLQSEDLQKANIIPLSFEGENSFVGNTFTNDCSIPQVTPSSIVDQHTYVPSFSHMLHQNCQIEADHNTSMEFYPETDADSIDNTVSIEVVDLPSMPSNQGTYSIVQEFIVKSEESHNSCIDIPTELTTVDLSERAEIYDEKNSNALYTVCHDAALDASSELRVSICAPAEKEEMGENTSTLTGDMSMSHSLDPDIFQVLDGQMYYTTSVGIHGDQEVAVMDENENALHN